MSLGFDFVYTRCISCTVDLKRRRMNFDTFQDGTKSTREKLELINKNISAVQLKLNQCSQVNSQLIC